MNQNELETCSNSSAPSGEQNEQPNTSAPAVRKPISAAKLAANRRNGRKSKGPKTEEGKSRARWNAVKHGVLSRRLLVLNDDDRQTYALLLENLERDLNPSNAPEQIVVEQIAMCYWRLQIAYGYEAEFARSRGEFLVVVDRIGRYSNTIHRQLLSAMNELERLQRRRLGEAVPAPIAIEVNVNDEREAATDEVHMPQASLPSLHALSGCASGRLIGSGTPEPTGAVLPSHDEATSFCETNPPGENTREPDPS